jgi:hypothetical protein
MNAHFFDIDTVIISHAKIWVVDKSKPSDCIIKMDQSDFNLVKSGIYRSYGNKIRFSGIDYYLPDDIMNKIKIRCKNIKCDASNLAFSMCEFLDPDKINLTNHTIDIDILSHLKNTQDDVYFICSKNNKKSYDVIIKKIEDKINDLGISPKNYYYVSETFYERDDDLISFDKVRLLLQHMVGYKTDGRLFTDDEVLRYDVVNFYDDDVNTVKLATDISNMFSIITKNSDSGIKERIKSVISDNKPELVVNLVSPNKVNRFSKKKVSLEYGNLIKSFESFKYLK